MKSSALAFLAALLLASAWVQTSAAGDDLLPAEQSIESAIDHYVDSYIADGNIRPAAQASDLNLIRRLTLDLAGRVPTVGEAKAFADSTDENKRSALIDRLLASPDYAFHNRNQLDYLLLANKPKDKDFRRYLLWASKENRKWDRMFRDMIVGDENDEYQKAAMVFLKSRVKSIDDVTNDTSSLFFGVNVSCAKCHDHPLVEDWKQDHFYGMSSFFSRTYLTKKNTLAEKHYGDVKFKTTKGVEKTAQFMFLTGSVISEPENKLDDKQRKQLDEEVKKQQKDDKAPPASTPKFSPRSQLVEMALGAQDNEFFAKNIANRIWHRLFGRGIVDPPDQIHSGNPATHPELLAWLARDLINNGYDLKRLIKGIAMSKTYSRSSAWTQEGDVPSPDYYAVSQPRVLTPRQYALSLLVVSRNPDDWAKDLAGDKWDQVRESYENTSNNWIDSFEIPNENFQIAVDEALFFSNNERIQNDLMRDSNDRLIGYLLKAKDQADTIDKMYWAICSRPPSETEKSAISQYLEKRQEDAKGALKQVVWALLSGSELRFNY